MPNDTIMDLYAQGLSHREIADRVGKTKNAVIGYIWRYRKRGPVAPRRPIPDLTTLQQAVNEHGGNLSAAANALGVSRKALYNRGFGRGSVRGPNKATDPETRSLVDAITASGLTDTEIAERVDMAPRTIYTWRCGERRASRFLAQCVRTVLEQNTPGY